MQCSLLNWKVTGPLVTWITHYSFSLFTFFFTIKTMFLHEMSFYHNQVTLQYSIMAIYSNTTHNVTCNIHRSIHADTNVTGPAKTDHLSAKDCHFFAFALSLLNNYLYHCNKISITTAKFNGIPSAACGNRILHSEQKIVAKVYLGVICTHMVSFCRPSHKYTYMNRHTQTQI